MGAIRGARQSRHPAIEAALRSMRPRPVPAEDDDYYFTEERFLEPE